jgi:hypothetical protein
MRREANHAWLILGGLALLMLAGCGSVGRPKDYTTTWGRFFLEASGGAAGTPLGLPRSGVNLTVNAKPVLTEGDIVNVELVQVELGKCLLFQLTPSAARDFYRLTGSHQGRRLVLVVNDQAIGARRIDGVITDGLVYIFVELPDEDLPQLVQNLKKSSVALQQELRRKA